MHKVGIEDSSRTRAGVESGELAAESQTFARAERAGPSSCKCNRAERTAVIPVRWSLVRWVPSHRCDACGVHGACHYGQQEHIADIITKGLHKTKFEKFFKLLGMVCKTSLKRTSP